jgi:hypothetical protein
MNREELARRKSLLVAQAHLHRLQAGMAWHDVKEVITPAHLAPTRGSRARSIAAKAIGIAVPIFGLAYLARILRTISIGLMIVRIVRGLRRPR